MGLHFTSDAAYQRWKAQQTVSQGQAVSGLTHPSAEPESSLPSAQPSRLMSSVPSQPAESAGLWLLSGLALVGCVIFGTLWILCLLG